MASKRFLLFIFIVIALSLAVRWMFFPKKEKSIIDLPTAETEYLDTFVDQVTCIGRPKPESERYVSVQKGGRLEVLNVKVGDTVAAGQILGIVDKTVNSANLKSALSSFRLAQKDYGRISGLARSGSASRDEFDKAQSNLEVKRAELERAKQGVEDGVLRAAFPGKVSVVVFKVGDKIPDGSRVAAIEAPGSLQLACRIPTLDASKLPSQEAKLLTVIWSNLEDPTAKAQKAPTSVQIVESGDFVGIDREIRLSTESPAIAPMARRRVQVSIPLSEQYKVTKLPSDAVIKRSDGFFSLIKDQDDALFWVKVDVIKRDATSAYVTGIDQENTVLRLVKDVSPFESQISKAKKKSANVSPDKG
jgi:multidrug efflux pump subunit AcrA (membrane-fusion protein)